jgi:hypothetical protein
MVIAFLGIIVLVLLPGIRREANAAIVTAAKGLLDVLRTPAQAAKLFSGVAGVTFANVLMLTAALHAFGVQPSFLASWPSIAYGASRFSNRGRSGSFNPRSKSML